MSSHKIRTGNLMWCVLKAGILWDCGLCPVWRATRFLSPTNNFCSVSTKFDKGVKISGAITFPWFCENRSQGRTCRISVILSPLRRASLHSAVIHQTSHRGKRPYVASTHGGDISFWEHTSFGERTVKKPQIHRKPAFAGSQNYSWKELTTPARGAVVR